MNKFSLKFRLYCCLFITSLSITLLTYSYAEENKSDDDKIYGNVVCLVPDLKRGNVSPVIANGSCKEHKVHAHVIVETRNREGNVYAVKGSEESIIRLQELKNKKNIEINGSIGGNQKALILTVE